MFRRIPKRIRSTEGFTMLEVVVAMGMLAIGLLGIAVVQITALRVSGSSRHLSDAMYLAEEQMEVFRSMPLASLPAAGITNDPGNPIQTAVPAGDATTYSRRWTITPNSPSFGVTTILVEVDWINAHGVVRTTAVESMRGL
ncbi:MAG: hypothetical protein HRU00_18005 [Myxococcales bacterium]|nr:hypothetical protein [Myxococcales bacterium]